MSVARSLLSPSQAIWAEPWDGRDASGKCQRPLGLDGVAGLGTVLGVQWSEVQNGCAWHRVVLGWALGLCLLGAKGQGCDVLRMHHKGGPDGDRVRLEEPCQGAELEALWRSAKPMHVLPWGGTTPGTSLCCGLPSWKAACQKRPWCAGGHQVEHKPSVCPRGEAKSLWSCIASSVSREFFLSTEPWEATAGVVGSEQEMGSQEGPQENLDVGAQAVSWDCSVLRRLRGALPMCTSVGWEEWRQAQTLSGA